MADTDNHCLRVVAPDGKTRTLAGNGKSGFGTGPGTGALFNAPWGVVMDPFDPANAVVYVVDGHNHRICRVTADGAVAAFMGSGTSGNADGLGTAASFLTPAGLAIDLSDKSHARLVVAPETSDVRREMGHFSPSPT